MDISIVIPTRDRCPQLLACLDSVFRQDLLPERFEVIVVDDGSRDGTAARLASLRERHKNLRYFSQDRKGPAAARNLGMRMAFADVVGFTDDDCLLDADWARKMVEAHRDAKVTAVGGATRVAPRNIRARVSQFLSDGAIRTDVGGKLEVIFFPTCNVALKVSLLKGVLFDESFLLPAGEDLDFFWRIFKTGGKLVHRPDIGVFHDCHPTGRSFLRQAYRYGRGNYRVRHLHGDQPLLKELKTGSAVSFIGGTLVNVLKIPRFAFLCGRRLISSGAAPSFGERFGIYAYFVLHKAMYLGGNIAEHICLRKPGSLGLPAAPEFFIFDATHRCNLKCNICEIRKDKSAPELPTSRVRDLIAQAREWGVKDFVLSGGEAFLRDDIFELLDFTKRIGYRVGVLTNGIILDPGFVEKIAPYLTSGALSLSISLDSLSPRIHDDIRGTLGSFEKTRQGLEILSKMKKAGGRVNFNTISIILNENLEELLPLAEYLLSLGVDSIQFQPLLANNLVMKERSGKGRYWIPPERWPVLDSVIDSLVLFKRSNGGLVRNSEENLLLAKKYFRGELKSGDVRCAHGARTMLVAPNGDVTTCFECYGNVQKTPAKRVYRSPKADRARARARNCQAPCLLPCFCDP